MKSDWIWFDLDDTLFDFKRNSRIAHDIIFDECRLDRFFATPDEWFEVYEHHNLDLWARYSRAEITQDFLRIDRFATPLRPRWDGDETGLLEFATKLDPLYLTRLAEQTRLIDGSIEILTHLRAHDYNIGVLSNGFKGVQHRKIENTGLAPLIDLIVLSDDIGINKPNPAIYAYAMEKSGVTAPERHTMVGDNRSTDIAGALASGWRAILLDPSAQQLSTDPDGVVVTPRLELLRPIFCGENSESSF